MSGQEIGTEYLAIAKPLDPREDQLTWLGPKVSTKRLGLWLSFQRLAQEHR